RRLAPRRAQSPRRAAARPGRPKTLAASAELGGAQFPPRLCDNLKPQSATRSFLIIAAAPYSGDGETSPGSPRAGKAEAKARARSGQDSTEGPGEAPPRQGGAPRAAADRAGARRSPQSRHRPGNRGPGVANGAEATT